MAVCREQVPPEVTFADRVRVACHLYPPGSDGAPRVLPASAPGHAAADAMADGGAPATAAPVAAAPAGSAPAAAPGTQP
jgi:hypothetical protein